MTSLEIGLDEAVEMRVVRLACRPIAFETFLDLNRDSDMELIKGVMVKKMAAQWEHEKLLAWLFWLLFGYVRQKNRGVVGGSRTTIKIDDYHARLPDLFFVRQEHVGIVQSKAVYGAPDLVIELISPNDRPSDMAALETDYRSIGVPEIVFIDQQKRSIRLLRKRDADYEEQELTTGAFSLETVAGYALQAEWLFAEQRPDELALLHDLLKI